MSPGRSPAAELGQGEGALSTSEFARLANVSRETLGRLEAYAALLTAWNPRINLVGPATLAGLWRRHMLDSAQLWPLLPRGARLVDLGSGGGFPGLVLAIMGGASCHLVEADARKCAFLREAARVTGTTVEIHNSRAERVALESADVVTARALAPLDRLLHIAERFIRSHTICLFLKGRAAAEELTAARKAWNMEASISPSLSDPAGAILRLENIVRVASRQRG